MNVCLSHETTALVKNHRSAGSLKERHTVSSGWSSVGLTAGRGGPTWRRTPRIASTSSPGFAAVDGVRRYLKQRDGRVVWSESLGRDGWSRASHKHGDFDNDDTTIKSVVHAIKAGFD